MLKFLLLIGGLAAFYYGYRYIQRREAEKAEARLRREQDPARSPDAVSAKAPAAPPAVSEDMLACPVCGTYRPATAGPCERPDCPARSA